MMESQRLSRDTIRTYLSPIAGGGSGIGADALSAYSDYAADVLFPWDYAKGEQMFPGGNTGIARHMMKQLIPESLSGDASMEAVCRASVRFGALDRVGQPSRIRLNATAIAVEHDGNPEKSRSVTAVYVQGGKLYSVRARSVIMAGGSWTTRHIVRDLPAAQQEAYAQFYRAPCLMANIAVRNWRFLAKMGISEAQWFEGIGNYTAVRKLAQFGAPSQKISPDSPVVLTLKILFSRPGLPLAEQVTRGRMELLSTSFLAYEEQLREQFNEMFGQHGFDARRDIAGIILNRWGHAYLSPQPGFFFGSSGKPAPGEVLRQAPYGRIAFANSDLAGIMDHRASIMEAKRAVQQVGS
jgi:spermidine dehydrogenase